MDNHERIISLARRSIDGDREAYGLLLVELEPLIVRTVRLVVGSGSWIAEDAAQEAFLDVIRGLEKVRRPEAVFAWALRVATTRALKIARKEQLLLLRRVSGIDPKLLGEIAREPQDERIGALKDAFDRLPPRLRATAILRLYLDLTEADTAAILGCSAGTVKSNLHDARRKLGESLRHHGLAPSTLSASGKEFS
ncbi:MAG: RNA polymerase sigma factor [Gaiellaceae bacterium]|jgi:RNA polymerase sigma-70 factor (ECF subfamily)